jgi:hypothetical protein
MGNWRREQLILIITERFLMSWIWETRNTTGKEEEKVLLNREAGISRGELVWR